MPKSLVYIILSGGSGNTNPRLSLGGAACQSLDGAVVSQTANVTSIDPISGITVLGGQGLITGAGTLTWTSSTGKLKWTDSGNNNYEEALGSDGLYQIDTSTGHLYLSLQNLYLPTGTHTCSYNIQDNVQNVFDDVGFSERSSNHNNYRCLWIKNLSTETLTNVTVSMSVSPTYGTIRLATEYSSALAGPVSQTYAEANNETVYGTYRFGTIAPTTSTSAELIQHALTNGPYLQGQYLAVSATQDSDGLTQALPYVIADENDSGNVLGGLSWASTLPLGTLLPGKYLSFWLKRSISAGASGSAYKAEPLKLQISFRR